MKQSRPIFQANQVHKDDHANDHDLSEQTQASSESGSQPLDKRLDGIERQLQKYKKNQRPVKDRPAKTSYGQAFQLSTEFVVAILVGVGLGWGIDQLAGTAPWGMILFLPLGFVAGILNVMRSAGVTNDKNTR